MPCCIRYPAVGSFRLLLAVCCATLCVSTGCENKRTIKPVAPRYTTLPPKQVPDFLKGTIFEKADLVETDPLLISGYGLVAKLPGTADNTMVPTTVRNYMLKEMVRHGWGSTLQEPPYSMMQPEDVLRSNTIAIVRVSGFLQPGSRRGDPFTVEVAALEGTNTTSLARGVLYRTDLKVNGANQFEPGYSVDVLGVAQGPVYVNPAYALESGSPNMSPQARRSLRFGVVLEGGTAQDYRPLVLRVRQPTRSMSRQIEFVIEQRFGSLKAYQSDKIASAKDEGIVWVQMPAEYQQDWEHFAGVMTHLYLNASPAFATEQSKKLAIAAVQPDAPLQDISYCWEGLGPGALPAMAPLLTHPDPAVAFAAARAAAFLGDPGAQSVLLSIASTDAHPFQLNAVQVLGAIPSSPSVNQMLRTLLDCNSALVRLEAYRVLAKRQDSSITSFPIAEKFMLDIVPSKGPPLIYASTRGVQRIAVIGTKPSLTMPALFTAMDERFSISSLEGQNTVTIYYRGYELANPVKIVSNPDVAELVARLGGKGPPGQQMTQFSYGDIVALLQAMSDQRKFTSVTDTGERIAASFVLESTPGVEESVFDAPPIPERGRPQSDVQTGPIGSLEPPAPTGTGGQGRPNN